MRGRFSALLLAALVTATACAGSDSNQAVAGPVDASDSSTSVQEVADGSAATTDDSEPSTSGESGADSEVRRELGLRLRPESDVPTNLLPPVEVHDVGQDRMVNFKNIFPAENPVLLWMWAPF